MIMVAFGVGVVVAMDEPDFCLPKDGLKLDVQRPLRLHVTQQDDGLWAVRLNGFNDVGELAVLDKNGKPKPIRQVLSYGYTVNSANDKTDEGDVS